MRCSEDGLSGNKGTEYYQSTLYENFKELIKMFRKKEKYSNIPLRLVKCLSTQRHLSLTPDIPSSIPMSHSGTGELTFKRWTSPAQPCGT